jgi:hypothetical protein
MQNTLYQFLYNSNIHESGWICVTLHFSKEGAQQAMEEHKKRKYEEFLVYDRHCIERDPEFMAKYPNIFGENENWTVEPIEIKP